MKRINTMVSDKSKRILIDYKNEHRYTTLDEALDAGLIELDDIRTKYGTKGVLLQ